MKKHAEILENHAKILSNSKGKFGETFYSLKNYFTEMISLKQSVDTIVISNKVIHQKLPPATITQNKNTFDSFFKCKIVDIVWVDLNSEKQVQLIPECIRKSLETSFNFNFSNINKIVSKIKQKEMAKLLRLVPQLLLKNQDHNYSPYYFKKASDEKIVPKQATGKPDDISIVVGVVVKADKNEKEKNTEMATALQVNKESILKEVDYKICYYVSNFKVKEEKKRYNSAGKFGFI